jgi:hypothetical protein
MLREQKLKAFSSELKREKKFASNVNLKEFKDYVPSRSYVRSTPAYKSHEGFTNQATTTARQQRHEYSGEYITGLATMHKSNIVPVGKGDDPKNYSTMRRN